MTVIIPDGYCQVLINLTSTTLRKGTAIVTEGRELNGQTLPEVAASFDGFLAANIAEVLTTEFFYEGTSVQSATEIATQSSTVQGTLAGAISPPNVAVLRHKLTGLRGRGAHGQNFIPGMLLDNDVDDSGIISPARQASIFEFFQALEGAVVADGSTGVILHSTGSLLDPTPVTGQSIDAKIASQRRRLRKGSGRRSSDS